MQTRTFSTTLTSVHESIPFRISIDESAQAGETYLPVWNDVFPYEKVRRIGPTKITGLVRTNALRLRYDMEVIGVGGPDAQCVLTAAGTARQYSSLDIEEFASFLASLQLAANRPGAP